MSTFLSEYSDPDTKRKATISRDNYHLVVDFKENGKLIKTELVTLPVGPQESQAASLSKAEFLAEDFVLKK
jgi:hypothetical protein